jgi:acetoin utilization protein AcuC
MAAEAVFIHSNELDRHPYPPSCPFSSQRAGMARDILASMHLLEGPGYGVEAPDPATREELEAFHVPGYLDALTRAEAGQLGLEGLAMGIGTEDTPVFHGLTAYAALATGATLLGARRVDEGSARVAFNPSGGYHHAGPAKAAGFCYVNDVALACGWLAGRGRRVLFLDIDAHHGDGVQEAFYARRDVMTISLHESGETLFPGTGAVGDVGVGDGDGFAVNVPLPAETHDEAFLRAVTEVALPLTEAYAPDVIVLEVGMDGLAGDPLAHMELTNNACADAVEMVLALGRPVLTVGGGGYHKQNTARGWALVWTVLCGEDDPHDAGFGIGGVMLESTEWQAGLRDRRLAPDPAVRADIDARVDRTIRAVKERLFALHGLKP